MTLKCMYTDSTYYLSQCSNGNHAWLQWDRSQVWISLLGVFCLSQWPLSCTALNTGSTLTAVPESTRPATLHGSVKWVSAFGLTNNNNKWWWWMWMVVAFWQTHIHSWLAWSEGWHHRHRLSEITGVICHPFSSLFFPFTPLPPFCS